MKSYIGIRKANEDNDDEEEEGSEETSAKQNEIEGMDMSSSKSKNANNKIQGNANIKSEKDYKKMVMSFYKIP